MEQTLERTTTARKLFERDENCADRKFEEQQKQIEENLK